MTTKMAIIGTILIIAVQVIEYKLTQVHSKNKNNSS